MWEGYKIWKKDSPWFWRYWVISKPRRRVSNLWPSHNILTLPTYLCLVLLQVSKSFVLVQIFWASPKLWLHLVPLQNLLCWHKNQFYWMKIIFLSATKYLWLPQYVNKFLVWHKKFGPAQNNLGHIKEQGIIVLF